MDIDSPPPPPPPEPVDRVLRRLKEFGVQEEFLEMLYPGIVAYVLKNPGRVLQLVSIILPPDEAVGEVIMDTKGAGSVKKVMKDFFRESMTWLKWMMFMGDPGVVLGALSSANAAHGVCGAVWGSNDIAYRCRTCEHDPTCAICVPCFRDGNHKDHDYSVIYTGGGCCDCGDVTAWKREGFCSRHKGAEQIQPLSEEYARSVGPVLDALLVVWRSKLMDAESVLQERFMDTLSSGSLKKYANELTFVVADMMLEFCHSSESLLSFVSKRLISVDGLLEILVKGERFLSESVVKKLHELLLKLLAEPIFKYEFAKVFLGYYPSVVQKAKTEDSDDAFKKYPLLSSFSVQIFTVPTLTPQLVMEMNLLEMLLQCLGDIFIHYAGEDGRLQTTKWGSLYETTIRVAEDIRFVISHKVIQKYVMHERRDILQSWMKLLSFLQGMSPLKRETGRHIEEEPENINHPFVLVHSMADINSLLLDGAFSAGEENDDDPFVNGQKEEVDEGCSVRHSKLGRLSQESSVFSMIGRNNALFDAVNPDEGESGSACHPVIPSSIRFFTYECFRAIENSLEADTKSNPELSRKISDSSRGNFFALKKTFSKFRRGRHIFGLSSSGDDHGSQNSSLGMEIDQENVKSSGLDKKTLISGETDLSAVDDNLTGGDSSTEVEAFRFLNLSHWPCIIYDVSSQDVSVHIPLHRLLSMLLQRALRRYYGESVAPNVISRKTLTPLSATCDDFFTNILIGCHPHGFSGFVMDHPLRNRVFIAQVHAGMWRKNGDAALLCCEWYRSVRWSEQGLELDLFLLQCCAAVAPADLYVNQIIERFGLSNYLSLNLERSSEYEPVLVQEMLKLIIQIVQERRFSGLTPAENLKRELVHKLAIRDATRSQLVKSLPRDLSKFDRLQEILDTVALYSNPSGFNQGKYSLRGPFWKELDPYHPRWSSREWQVAEERYLRHCNSSASTTQLPRWSKTYPPLKGISRIATCKVTFQIVRAVLFYALSSDKTSESRAPDNILLTALHLLSLALDICFQMRESMDASFYAGDLPPVLAFAGEEIPEALKYGGSEQSLLSVLVTLMRIHEREFSDNIVEAGSSNFSSLIGHLLKKFAELDSGCMRKLQQLAPELVMLLPRSISSADVSMSDSTSDSEKRKAKARERQAAILAKMKAQQSRFLSSIDSMSDDNGSKSGLEESCPADTRELEESEQVCCLCHDPNSEHPISFLVLLQKSRLLSFVNRAVPSWDQVHRSDNMQSSLSTNDVDEKSGCAAPSSGSGVISSCQLVHLVQNTVNSFSDYAQPAEVNDVIEFLKAHGLLSYDTRVLCTTKGQTNKIMGSLEMLEQEMYSSIEKEMSDGQLVYDSGMEIEKFSVTEEGIKSRRNAEYALLAKYVAALSREMLEHPLASETANADEVVISTSQPSMHDEFGPIDADGVYLSSCGHAVHQGCLDRYLPSVKERFVRRIIFGGQMLDPDQGEFLCPVCRQVANSALPSLPGDSQMLWKQPMISTVSDSPVAGPLSTISTKESSCLWVKQALHILQSCVHTIEKGDILRTSPLPSSDEITPNLDFFSLVLLKLYFPDIHDKLSGSKRENLSIFMWDTLKFSLVSMEIAARHGRTQRTPTYWFSALQKEFKSPSGFTLSLLLKLVQTLKSKNPLHVLQRLRGIQLFAESICFGGSADNGNSTNGQGGDISSILRCIDKKLAYPDTQFWDRAADPILAHDAFSSLMWVLFCLPHPFLSCEKSFLSLVHLFYTVSVAQAIITYCGKHQCQKWVSDSHDSLITDVCKFLWESGRVRQYFVSNHIDPTSDISHEIRRISSSYLRRCALLWTLLTNPPTSPFCNKDLELNCSPLTTHSIVDHVDGDLVMLSEVEELEKMFKVPQLDSILKNQTLRYLVAKWLRHFSKVYEVQSHHVLHSTPAVPFKLMNLPRVYQDLLQRYIKQPCVDCKKVIDEPALCLLCGKLCSPNWRPCCRDSGCQNHSISCSAGTGVFLLIKRTTILLQRCSRQATWHSLYLDIFGEEDVEMHRGKPLYLNEERYAALNSLFASHRLDRSVTNLSYINAGTFIVF